MIISMTGVSGAMGQEVIKAVLLSNKEYNVKALFLRTAKDKKVAYGLKSRFGKRFSIIFGDVVNMADCDRLVENSDYVVHMAALIPPKADHDAERTMATNFCGTKNIVEAIKNQKKQPKFIHISTIAVYGNRNYKHPWARVGDPLLPSAFDVYAASKLKAERYVMESRLENWTVLRQTALLHKDLLINNIKDGLMFHTSWNAPLEWVTARDSGTLIKNIIEYDQRGKADGLWKKCFNIGGGYSCRQTGYDTFDNGFKIIGGDASTFFEPPYNQCRNFHGVWFLDSDELERMFHYRQDSEQYFWLMMKKTHRIYGVAKIVPTKLIKKLVIDRLLKDENSPKQWIKKEDRARVVASFGGTDNISMCPSCWENYPLLCKGQIPNGSIDYNDIRKVENTEKNGFVLQHGYDETKDATELCLLDMQNAARYRGGKCLSTEMKKGDLYTPLQWQCHDGHTFFLTPYTVLFGGHWCPECCEPEPWQFDVLAKKIPYYAQVWYDTHAKGENAIYYFEDGKAKFYRLEGDKKCMTL